MNKNSTSRAKALRLESVENSTNFRRSVFAGNVEFLYVYRLDSESNISTFECGYFGLQPNTEDLKLTSEQ